MNHYPRHVGDFVKDTLGFNQGAIGAYDLLLDAYYANEEAIPADDVYVIGRATTASERKNVDRALTKFELRDGRYYHKRVEEELAAFRARSKAGADNAEKRWQKNANGDAKPDAKPNAKRMPKESRAASKVDASAMLASSHKPENPNPPVSVGVIETSPPPQPEHAPPPVEFPAIGDPRVSALHSMAIRDRVNGVRVMHAQQWVADGVTEEILGAAIVRARKRKGGQSYDVGWLGLMIGDVRAVGVGYDADAEIAAAVVAIREKEGTANVSH